MVMAVTFIREKISSLLLHHTAPKDFLHVSLRKTNLSISNRKME